MNGIYVMIISILYALRRHRVVPIVARFFFVDMLGDMIRLTHTYTSTRSATNDAKNVKAIRGVHANYSERETDSPFVRLGNVTDWIWSFIPHKHIEHSNAQI